MSKKSISRAELINKVQAVSGEMYIHKLPKADCENIINCFTQSICELVEAGKTVEILGFGTFEVYETKERYFVMPVGNKVIKPSHRKVKFKVGSALKRAAYNR